MVEALEKWGADARGAMAELLLDEKGYDDEVRLFLGDSKFFDLKVSMFARTYEDAYVAAHSLCVRAMKLRLLPLCEPLRLFTDRLRTRNYKDAPNLYGTILAETDELRTLMGCAV